LLVSAVTQILVIAYYWWDADPRASCERVVSWRGWIACLHGQSHSYVGMTETAIAVWIITGIGRLFGRILPLLISALVPAGVLVLVSLWAMSFWQRSVMPYAMFGEPRVSEVSQFAITASLATLYVACPVAAGWLLGYHARLHRRTAAQRLDVDVFD
jgi:hypothetical protein